MDKSIATPVATHTDRASRSRFRTLMCIVRHPWRSLINALSVDFDLSNCDLCDEETLHAELAEIFERER